MKSAIRCCISCILPCGALDVIRIIHTNGHVEEISGTIKASEILKLHPKHVLKRPSSFPSQPSDDGGRPKIVAVDPDSILKRGKIYFLIPKPPQQKNKHREKGTKKSSAPTTTSTTPSKKKTLLLQKKGSPSSMMMGRRTCVDNLVVCDQYLTEILSENKVSRERRRGRVGIWRPHLESISEMPFVDHFE